MMSAVPDSFPYMITMEWIPVQRSVVACIDEYMYLDIRNPTEARLTSTSLSAKRCATRRSNCRATMALSVLILGRSWSLGYDRNRLPNALIGSQ
jgi:hypothetical protein